MKALLESQYVHFRAVRPLKFGENEYAPGDKIPASALKPMRDPEVLVRTGRMAACAKDMNKVPRWLRKDVTDQEEFLARLNRSQGSQVNLGRVLDESEPEQTERQDEDDQNSDEETGNE